MTRAIQLVALLTLFLASTGRTAAVALTSQTPSLDATQPAVVHDDAPPCALESPNGLLCHNDPVNKVGPMGSDFWIINSRWSANAFGHNAVMIGQPNGERFTYHSFKPKKENKPFDDGKYVEKSFASYKSAERCAIENQYDRYLHYTSKEAEDEKGRTAARKWEGRIYKFKGSNCDNMVQDAADGAGVNYKSATAPNGSDSLNRKRATDFGRFSSQTSSNENRGNSSHPLNIWAVVYHTVPINGSNKGFPRDQLY